MARGKTSPAAAPAAKTSDHAGYTVLARRYRPQQFQDLIGQEAVARALVNALESNRVAHAYLFTGARGVGKTSAARILAKALNCVTGPTAKPCDQCDICKSIALGEDVDVLEIDGASNRGIDEVREIRQNVQYRPQRARHKIYIIDEVHMLTQQAFNALLKTLEEPPPHVKFIFATTEVQRIPVTILSRCQRFDFLNIRTGRIAECLKGIVAGEGVPADDNALELIARRAGGSMRDAQSLLDQLLAFGGERLTVEQVHRLLGTAGDERVLALAAAVLSRDAKRALELLQEAADEGLQLGELLDQLIAYWRDLMVIQSAGPEATGEWSVSPAHRETMAQQAATRSLDTILAGLDVLSATKGRLRGSGHPRVLLEMALVRLSRLEDLVALSQMAQWLAGAASAGSAMPAARAPAAAPRSIAPPEAVKKKLSEGDNGSAPEIFLAFTSQTAEQVWAQVLTQIGPMLAGILRSANVPAISGPNTLVISFPSAYNPQRADCQEPSRLARIEAVFRKVTGQDWKVRIETSAAAAPVPATAMGEEANPPLSRYQDQRARARQIPLIRRAIELLGADLYQLDDGFGAATATLPERTDPSEAEEA